MERAKEKGKVVQRDIERGGRERVREERQIEKKREKTERENPQMQEEEENAGQVCITFP